jgi:phage tail-like protein
MASGFKLYDALVLPLRQADRDHGNLLLQRFLKGAQTIRDTRIEPEIESLYDQIKPDKVRSDIVKYLKDIVGFTAELRGITDRLTETQLRRLIQVAVPLWNQRHTERGLINAIRLLTGRTAFVTTWFGFRNLLGETAIMEDQLAAGGDNWVIGGSVSTYDEQWSNIRVMDDGTLDELLLIDICRLMRPLGERFEIFLDDFLDKFDADLDKWSRTSGATDPTKTTTGEMSIPAGTEVAPTVPIISFDGDHINYNIVSKIRLEAAGSKVICRWYIDGLSRYDLEIQLTTPKLLLRHYDDAGTPTTLHSGDPASVSLASGTWYKLRIATNNVGADRHIQVFLDSSKVIPVAGDSLVHTPTNGVPSAGPYRFAASGGTVLLDNVESWRNPARYATVGLSTLTERGGAVIMSSGFLEHIVPLYLTTAEDFVAETGKTPKSIYMFDQLAGNVLDLVGSAHLTLVGGPTFRRSVGGKRGIAYDTLGAAHRANVNILGSKSGVMGFVFSSFDATDVTQHIWGAGDPGDAFRLRVQYQGGDGTINAQIQSGVNLVIGHSVPAGDNILRLGLLQIDQAADQARFGIYRPGVAQTTNGSIAGHGAYSGGVPRYGAGDLVTTFPGVAIHYAFHLEDAQCEGATVNDDLATALGWKV